jgi:hypothetical protein
MPFVSIPVGQGFAGSAQATADFGLLRVHADAGIENTPATIAISIRTVGTSLYESPSGTALGRDHPRYTHDHGWHRGWYKHHGDDN